MDSCANTLLKSDVTRRDHVSVVMDAGSRIVKFHSQFHSRRYSLRITLKYKYWCACALVCVNQQGMTTERKWQTAFNSVHNSQSFLAAFYFFSSYKFYKLNIFPVFFSTLFLDEMKIHPISWQNLPVLILPMHQHPQGSDLFPPVNRHLVYSKLVHYPFRLIAQARFSGLGLGLELGVGIRVLV